MKLGGYGFEKSELTEIMETTYFIKNQKREAQLELESEQFHNEYILKHKVLVEHEVVFRLLWIIPITLIVAASLFVVVYYFIHSDQFVGNNYLGILYLLCMVVLVYAGYAMINLYIREIKNLRLLSHEKYSRKGYRSNKNKDFKTFETELIMSDNRIDMLKSQVDNYDNMLFQLKQREEELINQQKEQHDKLNTKENVKSKNSNRDITNKISLRDKDFFELNVHELYEYYSKEETYLNSYIKELELQLQRVNQEINQLQNDLLMVKKIVFRCICIYLILIIIYFAFCNVFPIGISIICMFVCYILLVYTLRKCQNTILKHLIESEHPLISEYAFINGMVPIKYKKNELINKITLVKNDLNNVLDHKQKLVL